MNTENNKSNLSGAEAPNSGGQISEAAPTSGQSPLLPNVKAQRRELEGHDAGRTDSSVRCSAWLGSAYSSLWSDNFFMGLFRLIFSSGLVLGSFFTVVLGLRWLIIFLFVQ